MECGALYSMSLIAMMATYLSGSNGAYIVLDMVRNMTEITLHADTALDRPNYSNHLQSHHRSDSDAAVQ
jgi:hypothetical protein